MRDFLTITDSHREEIQKILDYSSYLQEDPHGALNGKNILFAFEKPSLRTKVGTEVAISTLGGHVIHVESDSFFGGRILHAGNKNPSEGRESLRDTVKNVSQWCDGIFARVFSHKTLLDIQSFSDIPVINALSDTHHPMQALADLKTIQDAIGKKTKVLVTFVGDANNVAYSLIEILLLFGHDVRFSGPEEYSWTEEEVKYFEGIALQSLGKFEVVSDPKQAVKGAAFVYTDTFVSMGEENEYDQKISAFQGYQVNAELMSHTENAFFMHCLPAHRGIEVTDEVIDGETSLVYPLAKNRMVVSKGLFAYLLR